MKKLNKPKKYSETNVEFYASEVQPVQSPAPTNNNTNNPYSGGFNSTGSNGGGSSSSSSKSPSFAEVLEAALNRK